MRLYELDYNLPSDAIAQRPLERRDASRLLLLNRTIDVVEDRKFAELPLLLRGDELLVFNNARVIPARLFGRKVHTAGKVFSEASEIPQDLPRIEVFLARQLGDDVWEALVRPGRKIQVGDVVRFGEGELECRVTGRGARGLRVIRFTVRDSRPLHQLLDELGHVPLPPYIDRPDETFDRERYQTVFAKNRGAVAAPTAGLHFTAEILQAIRDKGAEICELTLHVGLGTFQPVRTDNLEEHVMHGEIYEITPEVVKKVNAAKAANRPIVAVGTTVVRALEDFALRARQLGEQKPVVTSTAEARLFITPGFEFRVVDQLLTNFHLPRSTLLALVCALAGRKRILSAYQHAVETGYRFYSYGDCMLIR
jgi:S-adenosylmethionine:tRNA ribosyltransferase-isomerase